MKAESLQQKASKVLHDIANGIFNADEIGNLIRDFLHVLRMRL